MPSDERLNEIYSEEYYSTEKPEYIERYTRDKKWWNGVYEERYKFLESNLDMNQRSLLDIGSGPGLFIAKGRQRGWRVKGLNHQNKQLNTREELNLDVSEEFLTMDNYEKFGKYDVINMGEVLEHLVNPSEMIKMARQMLNNRGIICIVVPMTLILCRR